MNNKDFNQNNWKRWRSPTSISNCHMFSRPRKTTWFVCELFPITRINHDFLLSIKITIRY